MGQFFSEVVAQHGRVQYSRLVLSWSDSHFNGRPRTARNIRDIGAGVRYAPRGPLVFPRKIFQVRFEWGHRHCHTSFTLRGDDDLLVAWAPCTCGIASCYESRAQGPSIFFGWPYLRRSVVFPYSLCLETSRHPPPQAKLLDLRCARDLVYLVIGGAPNKGFQATPQSASRFEVPSVASGHSGAPEPRRSASAR